MPPHGAKMGPEGGPTQANATEALLLPGPRVEDRRRPCPHMAPRWAQKGGQPRPVQLRLCCSRGPGLKIEGDDAPTWRQDGPHGAKMGPEGGSTQASATEALLLPGPRVEDRRRPCPHMAPRWAQKGGQPRPVQLRLCCSRGPGLKIEGDDAPTWRQDGPHGAKMGPEGGSTQASATEALLLPGPRVEDRRRRCPHMAPRWAQKGGQPRPVQLRLCCSRGPG